MDSLRPPKLWPLSKNETITSFENWRQVVIYSISLNKHFAPFLTNDAKWTISPSTTANRGLSHDGNDVPQADRRTAEQKCASLELMLGQIAVHAPIVSQRSIVKCSTSLSSIWQTLRLHYGFASTGAHFLNLACIRLQPDEKAEDLYQRIAAFYDDNLLAAGSTITHHGVTVETDEQLTPTLENTIVVLWLQLLHPDLPALVRQKYGSELRHKTLASIRPEISQALPSLLDEIRSLEETKVMRSASYQPRRKPFKSCTLCKAMGKPSASTHNLSECKFLPEGDRRALARSRLVASDGVPDTQCVADDHDDIEDDDSVLLDFPTARRVEIVQSPALDVYFGPHVVRLTLDTGATSTMVRHSFARRINMPIIPTTQAARQADGKTPLIVRGEVHCEVTRGATVFRIDGLVVDELDVDVLAGTSFMKTNDIATRPAKNQIVIRGRDIVHYGSQAHSDVTARRVQAFLCRSPPRHTVLMPGDFIEFATPNVPDSMWALEPRIDCSVNRDTDYVWPIPQEIQSVDNTIRVVNTREDPILLRRNQHVCQIRPVSTVECTDKFPTMKQSCAPQVKTCTPFSAAVSLDPDNCLPAELINRFKAENLKYDDVFDPSISKYNGASGKIEAVVNMGPVLPPQRKGRLPHYNNATLIELQDKFDELEAAGVFAKPEDANVTVEYLNLSFLVKKASGGTRLVTSFGEVGTYSKPQPSLMPNVDKVLRDIASWNYIIVSDLLKSFYQIPLAQSSMKYCGVATPFKGIRVYTRSAMGMPGSETCLEELMSRVLGNLILEGRVAKLADDLYCGGQTADEALENWSLVLSALHRNNLHLSARKTIICPKSTVILGWVWSDGTLRASPHKLSALAIVDPPQTVQGLRSFVGAYKVLSRVLPGYATFLHPLEQATAGRSSKDRITWTEELHDQFKAAQTALSSNKTITLPRHDDVLWIVTDGAVKTHGIGATLYILRKEKLLLAGFFNAKLRKHQITWLPCEVEALCISASIKHFAPYIIQATQTTQLLTDSRPCVQAYDKLCRGEFSNSSRVTTYLSTVSRYQIHVGHIAGAANLPSDYTSRNPVVCPDQSCQVCKFVAQHEDCVVRVLSVKDVMDGSFVMPFTSRAAWHATQLECPDLRRTHAHLTQGTRPSKKATRIHDTKRYLNIVTVAKDGLLVVKDELPFHHSVERTVVPRSALDGLLTALHIRFEHPSGHQLRSVFSRYFYALDLDKAVDIVSANCHHCSSLKSFPAQLQPQSTESAPDAIGFSFAADIMRRHRQYILVMRETVSSFTRSMFVDNERHDELRNALLILCADFKPPNNGVITIRVDAAPAFKSLSSDPLLKQHGISLVIGNEKNINKNPVAERAIQELGRECLNVSPEGGPLSSVTLALATSLMNSRIRNSGLSAYELWTQRDQVTCDQLPIMEKQIIDQQHHNRLKNHPYSAKSKSLGKPELTSCIAVGDLIYLRGERDKTKCRDKYIVIDMDKSHCKIRKFTKSQFRSKSYDVRVSECYPVFRDKSRQSSIHSGSSSDSNYDSENDPSSTDISRHEAQTTTVEASLSESNYDSEHDQSSTDISNPDAQTITEVAAGMPKSTPDVTVTQPPSAAVTSTSYDLNIQPPPAAIVQVPSGPEIASSANQQSPRTCVSPVGLRRSSRIRKPPEWTRDSWIMD